MENKNPKRFHQDTDTDSDNESTWPQFLVIRSTDDKRSLKNLSPFAIQKGIQGLAGEPKSVKKLKSGDLLVEVCRKHHSLNLLKSKMMVNVPIEVSPHKTLNTRKGVIRCRELKSCSNEEILEGLSSQKVKEVYQIKVKQEGNRVPCMASDSFLLYKI